LSHIRKIDGIKISHKSTVLTISLKRGKLGTPNAIRLRITMARLFSICPKRTRRIRMKLNAKRQK
jgi:hypothetical protein